MASIAVALLSQAAPRAAADQVPFTQLTIDDNSGDCKMVGDIDGDGLPDLVLAGAPGEDLNWYRYPDWQRTIIAIPTDEFTTDAELGDVDGDGDLDVVVPDGPAGDNLHWFENPLPAGDPLIGSQWVRHTPGSIGDWGKDIELADFDHDGRLDIATRTHTGAFVFFQIAPDTWSRVQFAWNLTGEGMTSGDIDGDGDTDIVLRGRWFENPAPTGDPRSGSWASYSIDTGLYPDLKALVTDLNGDGHADVLYSDSEGTGDVAWYEPSTGDPTGPWTKHLIVANLERCHTLQAADIDLDGDLDVVLGQMHTSVQRQLMVYYNANSAATAWNIQVIDATGLHNGVVADIGCDGDYDIFGCNWTGNPPLRLWENELSHCPPGDLNHDLVIDLDDVSLLLAAFDTTAGDAQFDPAADLDTDGDVDLEDLATLLGNYGLSCGPR